MSIHYAGFWVRAIADLVDSCVLDIGAFLFELVVLGLCYWVLSMWSPVYAGVSFMDAFNPLWIQVGWVACRGVLSLFYFTWGTYRYGTTLGKRLLRIYVVPEFSDKRCAVDKITLQQSLIRGLGYLVSYVPLGAGFLMVVFHPERRALHDLMAGTCCVVKR